MLNVVDTKVTYVLPENFNEMTAEQIIEYSSLLLKGMHKHPLKVLRVMLGKSHMQFFKISAEHKAFLAEQIEWAFKENNLTNQLIPKYNGYYAPRADFDNLTLGEFHYSETFYQELVSGDDTAINRLIAVLYRRPRTFYNHNKDSHGDPRTPFNPNEIPYYEKIIEGWNPAFKMSVVLWYDGCRQMIIDLYDTVFTAADSSSQTKSGMYNVIRNLSGDRYGTIDKVESVLLHSALFELETIIREVEQQNKLLNR